MKKQAVGNKPDDLASGNLDPAPLHVFVHHLHIRIVDHEQGQHLVDAVHR